MVSTTRLLPLREGWNVLTIFIIGSGVTSTAAATWTTTTAKFAAKAATEPTNLAATTGMRESLEAKG